MQKDFRLNQPAAQSLRALADQADLSEAQALGAAVSLAKEAGPEGPHVVEFSASRVIADLFFWTVVGLLMFRAGALFAEHRREQGKSDPFMSSREQLGLGRPSSDDVGEESRR